MAQGEQAVAQRRADPSARRRLDRQTYALTRREIDDVVVCGEKSIGDERHDCVNAPRRCKMMTGVNCAQIRGMCRRRTPEDAETSYTISCGCCDFSLPASRTDARWS
jgi:hypothetical protein